ncbi:LysR family transcriptional regulator [Brevibacterium atlanticum]|uniref:LysR family transcriptional regulator n=1 Tax=Brevibacterium atlanticum TaxID=2697563 RepID=UPI00141E9429|nr:LysR family transcriptional regulator [Brevibacterium atlanticum]
MIDNRLVMLSMIDRHGTVTAAAHALHYSPSTVSHQIRQLAAELGVTLLEQRGRTIRLTAAALSLLRHVDAMSTEWERALAELGEHSDEVAGSIGLCGFSTAAGLLLPPTMKALNERFPRLRTQTIEAEPGECFDFLLAGDADVGVVVATSDIPAGADARFHQRFLIDDPLDLMVPLDHPLAERESVTIADTASQTWILGRPGTTYHQLVMASCTAAGFTPIVGHYANDWNTGTALVHSGFGICVASRLSRSQDLHPVRRIPLSGENAPTRHISAVTRAGAEERLTIRFTLDALSEETQRLMARLERDLLS